MFGSLNKPESSFQDPTSFFFIMRPSKIVVVNLNKNLVLPQLMWNLKD